MRLSLAIAVSVGALLFAFVAFAENSAGSCSEEKWELKRAPANHKSDDDVTYNEDWTPVLEEIAGRLKSEAFVRACVVIQGHSDQVSFSPEVAAAFGSVEAAQMARARARSIVVISRFHRLGVPVSMLREMPPSPEPTFRGVSIELIRECTQSNDQLPEWISTPEALEDTLRSRGTLAPAPAPTPEKVELTKPIPPPTLRPPDKSVWLGLRMGPELPLGTVYRSDTDATDGTAQDDVISTGMSIELDAGMRIAKVFMVFAFWEHIWLGDGSSQTWREFAGGQDRQFGNYWGIGGRWMHPIGRATSLNVELGAGYRALDVEFKDGTRMKLGSPIEARTGLGFDYRITSFFAVEALILASGGVYALRELEYAESGDVEVGGDHRFHAFLSFNLLGHFDVVFW